MVICVSSLRIYVSVQMGETSTLDKNAKKLVQRFWHSVTPGSWCVPKIAPQGVEVDRKRVDRKRSTTRYGCLVVSQEVNIYLHVHQTCDDHSMFQVVLGSEWLTKHRRVTRRATSCAREVRDALDFGIVSRQQEMGRGPCVERPDESMVDGEMDGILDRLGTNAWTSGTKLLGKVLSWILMDLLDFSWILRNASEQVGGKL